MKKMQESEELRMNIKFYEQKCDNYELKLDERENAITRLKTKLMQRESDMARMEYEYQKLRTSTALMKFVFFINLKKKRILTIN